MTQGGDTAGVSYLQGENATADMYVSMTVENSGPAPVNMTPYTWQLVDDTGATYQLGPDNTGGLDDWSINQVVPQGLSARGGVFFGMTPGTGRSYFLTFTTGEGTPTWSLGSQ